jgi:hypothetical protein
MDDWVSGAEAKDDRDVAAGGDLLGGEQGGRRFDVLRGEIPAEGLDVRVVAGGGQV